MEESRRQNGFVNGRKKWENMASNVYQEELGREAYRQAVDRQRKIFKVSEGINTDKGGIQGK